MSEQIAPDGIISGKEQEPIRSEVNSITSQAVNKTSDDLNQNDKAKNGVLLQPFELEPNLRFQSDLMIRDLDVPFLFIAKKLMNILAKSSVKLTQDGYLPIEAIDTISSIYLSKYNDLSISAQVTNQLDFPSLHACLSVLQLGGWIRKYQGFLSLTKKGKQKQKQLRGTKHNAWFLTELLQLYRQNYKWQSELECSSELEALTRIHHAFSELISALWQTNNKEIDSTWFLTSIKKLKSDNEVNVMELNHVLVEHFFIRFAWRFGLVIKPKLSTDNVLIRQSKLFSRWISIKD